MKMTRVLGLLVCFAVASQIEIPDLSSFSDPFYESAVNLLENYSSHSTNITHIKYLLEKSAENNNPAAWTKLGEFWLFGLPVSPDNPASELLDSSHHFKRDIPKAIKYFKKAHRAGNGNAAFFLALLLQQSLLAKELKEYTPFHYDLKSALADLYMKGLQKESPYARAAVASAYVQCINSKYLPSPSYLSGNQTLPFYKAPFFDEKTCGGTCENLATHALSAASEAIMHINKLGHQEALVPSLDTQQHSKLVSGEKSIRLFEKHVQEVGDSRGYVNIGDNYMAGNPQMGIERNPQQAARYYEIAAGQENLRALENLGAMNLQGVGVPVNVTKALDYLHKAKSMGSSKALNTLGHMYIQGLGVSQDKAKGLEYIKQAAELGNIESLNTLGVFYLKGEIVDQNYQTAFNYFKVAALEGHAGAEFNLGVMYLQGLGVERSCQNALELFRSVREKGELAQVILRALSFYKYGDLEGTYLTYMLGAALGFESAQLSAAYMWENLMVPFECKYSREYCAGSYYTQAAHMHKSQWAFLKIADILYNRESYTEAFKFYTEAKEFPEAVFSLGYMFESGLGVPKNTQKALDFYNTIVTQAKSGLIEHYNLYPALLAYYKLKVKTYCLDLLELVLEFFN